MEIFSNVVSGLPPPSAKLGGDSPLDPVKLVTRPGFGLDQTPFVVSDGMTLVKTSEGLGWPSLFVALSDEKPHEGRQGAAPELWITMALERADVRRIIGGREQHQLMEPCRISIAGPGTPVQVHLGNETRALHAFLKQDLLEEVARELFDHDAGRAEIVSAFGIEDLATGWLLRSIKQSLYGPAQHSNLRIEYLARALAAEVVSKHAVLRRDRVVANAAYRLSALQIRRVLEYVREHLASDISLNELAAVAGIGRTVFVQRFKASFRETPHQYLMQARVGRAQEMLIKTDFPISQIASICGFADQAHFSDVFKRVIGTPPSLFRRYVK